MIVLVIFVLGLVLVLCGAIFAFIDTQREYDIVVYDVQVDE